MDNTLPWQSLERIVVVVKPNARSDAIISWDPATTILKVGIAAAREDNKANLALLKFLQRECGRQPFIITGARARKKVIGFQAACRSP